MRRRLWWSLALFDSRMCQISGSQAVTLEPTWDCKLPINVNDSDLRPEMKSPPAAMDGKPTEALFAVVHSELGDFFRHADFYLSFTTPALKPLAKHAQAEPTAEKEELIKLEEMIETRYLKRCDQDNPVHFMAIWTARAHLAKYRLLEHHSRHSNSPSESRTEAQQDEATSSRAEDARVRHEGHDLSTDQRVFMAQITGFFPFPAYVQIVQHLRRRPLSRPAQGAWEVMSDNYEAWLGPQLNGYSPFYRIFAKIVLQAWEACEAAQASSAPGGSLAPYLPRIVSSIKDALAYSAQDPQSNDTEQPDIFMGMEIEELPMPTPTSFAGPSLPTDIGMPGPGTRLSHRTHILVYQDKLFGRATSTSTGMG